MTTIHLRIKHPSTGEPMNGSISFTPRRSTTGRSIGDDGAVVSGVTTRATVQGEDSSVDLIPSPAGWHYRAVIRDESGWGFTEHVTVPGEVTDIDYADLDRIDPFAAGLAYSPDPEWWEWARRIDELGGIPGKSAKEIAEEHEDRLMTDQEFISYITGPRGDSGEDGRDGETYLDYFRQEVEDPDATREDYHEWIRGRDFLEQWAVYVGQDPTTAEMEDALDWLHGDTALELFRQQQGDENLTPDDLWEYLRGPQGRDSYVPGPPGPRGDSAYEAVVNSGYGGSEEDFADELMGRTPEWEEVTGFQNGWTSGNPSMDEPLRVMVSDGVVYLSGIITPRSSGVNQDLIVTLPEEFRPRESIRRDIGGSARSHPVAQIAVEDDGEMYIHHWFDRNTSAFFIIDAFWPAREGSGRPRIPGPQGADGRDGVSAAESARRAGWSGEDYDFYERMRSMAHISDDDWDRFMETTSLSRGPTGPRGQRGRSAYEVVADSGYDGSEEDFAGELLGEPIEWQTLNLLGGWEHSPGEPLQYRIMDDTVELRGRVHGGGSPEFIATLPEEITPDASESYYRAVGNSSSSMHSVVALIRPQGDISISQFHRPSVGLWLSFDITWPVDGGKVRPRIPGPQGTAGDRGEDGKSAHQTAEEHGYTGTEEELGQALTTVAEVTSRDTGWRDFSYLLNRSQWDTELPGGRGVYMRRLPGALHVSLNLRVSETPETTSSDMNLRQNELFSGALPPGWHPHPMGWGSWGSLYGVDGNPDNVLLASGIAVTTRNLVPRLASGIAGASWEPGGRIRGSFVVPCESPVPEDSSIPRQATHRNLIDDPRFTEFRIGHWVRVTTSAWDTHETSVDHDPNAVTLRLSDTALDGAPRGIYWGGGSNDDQSRILVRPGEQWTLAVYKMRYSEAAETGFDMNIRYADAEGNLITWHEREHFTDRANQSWCVLETVVPEGAVYASPYIRVGANESVTSRVYGFTTPRFLPGHGWNF